MHVHIMQTNLLEGHNDELRVFEVSLEHHADVLRVRQVKCGINLVQDVHRRRFEEQQAKDERKLREGEGDCQEKREAGALRTDAYSHNLDL